MDWKSTDNFTIWPRCTWLKLILFSYLQISRYFYYFLYFKNILQYFSELLDFVLMFFIEKCRNDSLKSLGDCNVPAVQ